MRTFTAGAGIRKSIHEDELNKAPDTVVQPQEGASAKEPAVVYEWSENLYKDIALARGEEVVDTAMA